jgi:hypothetical protein
MLENGTSSITQCGRNISRQQLDEIIETVGLFPNLSRQGWLQPSVSIWDG